MPTSCHVRAKAQVPARSIVRLASHGGRLAEAAELHVHGVRAHGARLASRRVDGYSRRMPQHRDGPLHAAYFAGRRRVEHAVRTHDRPTETITRERVLSQPDVELFCVVVGFGFAPGLSACAAADPIRDTFEELARAHPAGLPVALASRSLHDAIQAGHQGARRLAAIDGDPKRQFGATVAAVVLSPGRAVVAHVGADRVHLWRDGSFVQLTHDHSLLNDYVANFTGPAEEVARIRREFPYKQVIVRALGVAADVNVDVVEHAVRPGDRLLITSRSVGDCVDFEDTAFTVDDVATAETFADRVLGRAVSAAPYVSHAVVALHIA